MTYNNTVSIGHEKINSKKYSDDLSQNELFQQGTDLNKIRDKISRVQVQEEKFTNHQN